MLRSLIEKTSFIIILTALIIGVGVAKAQNEPQIAPPPTKPPQINPVDDADINFKYSGPINSLGKAEGQGAAQGRDKYVGEFKNGQKSGYGVYEEHTGVRYEGEFANDLANGRGVSLFPFGLIYEGDHKDGYFQGQGTLSLRHVFTYTGEFSNNKFDGYGVLEKYGQMTIKGRFKDGKPNGFCVITVPGGNGYQGEFQNGLLNGLVTFFDYHGKNDYTTFFNKGREVGPREKVRNSLRKLI
ncbi:MAG: hypothetical protein LBI10_02840 [Deltaproteobacteria bacterium]|jgi:hypothetical protein|nr:hypothetical protein [Deltaproteobacteria bacterium]